MTNREPLLPRAWRDTEDTRRSVAWWTAAVLSGAALGVGGYYIAPDGNHLLWAFLGVVTGFFAPYALAVIWGMPPGGSARPVSGAGAAGGVGGGEAGGSANASGAAYYTLECKEIHARQTRKLSQPTEIRREKPKAVGWSLRRQLSSRVAPAAAEVRERKRVREQAPKKSEWIPIAWLKLRAGVRGTHFRDPQERPKADVRRPILRHYLKPES